MLLLYFIYSCSWSLSFLCFQAKQRASIKWLLSKAYDHKTPEELVEPFYKDHDVRELNSKIVIRLFFPFSVNMFVSLCPFRASST